MKSEIKLAVLKTTEAHIAISDCIEAQIAALKGIPDVAPFANVKAGLCEIQDKMHDMFVELEATIKSLDKT